MKSNLPYQAAIVPETWQDVPGFVGLYQVSDFGNIRSLNYNGTRVTRVLKPGNNGRYNFLHLWGPSGAKRLYVHRLVAMTFLPTTDETKTQVNHKDGNGRNNKLANLEWVSRRENYNHAFRNKLYARGERQPVSKLKEHQIKEILNLRGKISVCAIARKYHVCPRSISQILNGETWRHVTEQFDLFPSKVKFKGTGKDLNEGQVRQIREMEAAMTYLQIAEQLGLKRSQVWRVLRRVTYKNIA